jgi:hypothetical protein
MGLISSTMDAGAIKIWCDGLMDMDSRMLKNGLIKARDFTGYMTLPAFRELCRFQPGDFGIPTVQDAFDLIYKTQMGKFGDLQHPVVYQAMIGAGTYELNTLSAKDAFRRFEFYYDSASKRFMAGEEMTLPPEAIPEKIERPKTEQEIELSKKNAQKAIEQLKKLFK